MGKVLIFVSFISIFASCVKPYDLDLSGDNTEAVLNVAATALLHDGKIRLDVYPGQFSSHFKDFPQYPLDNLQLEVEVDGEKIAQDDIYYGQTPEGRIISANIADVGGQNPDVQIRLTDLNGNFSPVSAQARFPGKADWSCEITPIYDSQKPNVITDYRADIQIKDDPSENNYYMLAVEYLYSIAINGVTKVGGSTYWQYGFNMAFNSLGFAHFNCADALFHDSYIKASIGGFTPGFSNVFSDRLFSGKDVTFQIAFPAIDPTSFYGPYASSESLPIIIHLMSIPQEHYNYIKKMQYYLSDDVSIFEEPSSLPTNIANGYGFFTVMNDNIVSYNLL